MKNLEKYLERKAYLLRELSIRATTQAGSGHPTSCLSAADIVATLFFHVMRYDPSSPDNPNNDRFILSKGHAAPVLYAAWKEAGVISEQELLNMRTFNSVLEGHPTPRFSHVDVATGSLGQGLSMANGMCLSARLDALDFKTYVLMGDAEVAEGSIWEACELAAFYKLNNLIGIVDVNRLGQSDQTIEGTDVQDYARKFGAFGWHTIIINGHSIPEILNAFQQANKVNDKPIMIIAKTIKGYGIHDVADKNGFHGKAFKKKELQHVLEELKVFFKDVVKYPDEPFVPNMPTKAATTKPQQLQHNGTCSYTKGEQIATRYVYGQALAALGNELSSVVSLDGDVKNSTYAELFEKSHPDRFFQCFVAEQNMVGMGVGLAARHKKPFVSTFASFFSRAFDQLRMAAISRSHLRCVGSHAGVSIGQDGPSQMGLEDIALFRTLPDSIVLYPCDAVSAYKLIYAVSKYEGISYVRMTRATTPVLYNNTEEFPIGGCKIVQQSSQSKVCIVAAGITVHEALKAHASLVKENIPCTVIDLYSIKPLDYTTLLSQARASGNKVITVEDHYLEGGLGQAVAYALRNDAINIECLAVTKLPHSGSTVELLAYEDIDAAAIIKTVKKMIR